MSESLKVNSKISHYRIVRKIGAGGMGEVYLAEDSELERQVALKILSESFAGDNDRVRRFIQEAKAASALNHPNILTIYEIGSFENSRFIATEYINGETLRDRLQRESLDLAETLEITIQIALALLASHEAGIIHRDIKPENVMLRRDGLAKVLDFGLAKLVETKPENVDADAATRAYVNTQAGMILGTVAYMSPEQARGKKVDARTDLWSLGVVLYEMLTGHQPFAAETMSDVIAAILKSEPSLLRSMRPQIPAELEHIVFKTLKKDAGERYQNAKDLLFDLRQLKKRLEIDAELNRTSEQNQNPRKTQITGTETTASVTESFATAEYGASGVKQRKISFALGLAVLLCAAIGFGVWFFGTVTPPQQPPNSSAFAPVQSIAVLPFVNEGGNADIEYLSDGITESLISSLSQLPKLSVKARSSVFRYKGKEVEPQIVGAELSVQAVLNGRVAQRGEQLILNIELADTKTGNVLWTEQYNRKTTDLIALQSEIARDVSQKLRLRLSGAEEQRVAKSYTQNTEAYQLYLKGRFYWNKRTGEGLKKSVEYFNQAIEQDPNYALAFAGLAESYVIFSGYAVSPPQDAYPKAKAAAKKALEIDETLAEAHAALGLELLAYEWNAAESSREFQRAIELNPNYATARHWYGNQNLLYTGRFEEAIAEMKRAQELDPLSLVINTDLGDTYFYARQYDKAIEQLRKTIEMDQSFYYAHYELGMAYEMKGAYAEAIGQYQKARELNNDPRVTALLGHALAMSGRRDEALKTLDELKETAKQHYVPAYNFAILYAGLKDRDRAFEWLEKSYRDRSSRMAILQVDPFLDNLRSDARLTDLIGRVGLMK